MQIILYLASHLFETNFSIYCGSFYLAYTNASPRQTPMGEFLLGPPKINIYLIELFSRDSGLLARVPMALTALPREQLCREVSSSSDNNLRANFLLRGVCLEGTACSQACHVDLNKKDSWRERKQSFSFVVNSFLFTVAVKICSLLCPPEAQAIRLKDGQTS